MLGSCGLFSKIGIFIVPHLLWYEVVLSKEPLNSVALFRQAKVA
jgi:hypothetical protein